MLRIDGKHTGQIFKSYQDTLRIVRLERIKKMLYAKQRKAKVQSPVRLRSKYIQKHSKSVDILRTKQVIWYEFSFFFFFAVKIRQTSAAVTE